MVGHLLSPPMVKGYFEGADLPIVIEKLPANIAKIARVLEAKGYKFVCEKADDPTTWKAVKGKTEYPFKVEKIWQP